MQQRLHGFLLAAVSALSQPAFAEPEVSRARGLDLNTSAATPAETRVAAGSRQFPIYLTGYTWWDNTPPGS
ncbi:MAG TPA: hypothetical protein PKM44_07770, partial [Turneriella sp.]|nr:hypothetical protein [Turneriella sp.]